MCTDQQLSKQIKNLNCPDRYILYTYASGTWSEPMAV